MQKLEFQSDFQVTNEGEITGIAWPFGSPDHTGDEIEKGAFANQNTSLPMLFAHNESKVIGRWNSFVETDDGLVVKGKLFIEEISLAREVHSLVKGGAVSGLSVAFKIQNASSRPNGGRIISDLNLTEVSVVPDPTHPGAQITQIKGNKMSENEIETLVEQQELDTKLSSISETVKGLTDLGGRVDELEANLARPNLGTSENDTTMEDKSFESVMRAGEDRVSDIVRKSLSVGTNASAGYLAPPTFSNELLKLLKEFSPIRQYARVISVGSPETLYPRRVGSPTAIWVGETDARTSSGPSYEQISIKPHELSTFTDVSNALLEDAAFDIAGELRQEFAEAFAASEGLAFLKGTGDANNQPVGLLTNSDITEIKTGKADGFVASNPADVLVSMYHKIATTHAQRGVWMMNRNTLAVIRKWQDTNGRYLIVDPLTDGMKTSLFGRPVVECLDMDDIAAGKFPIVFGDLQGYRIVDRVQLQVLRDPYSLANVGQTRFVARRRTGGDVTHSDRFIKMKVSV